MNMERCEKWEVCGFNKVQGHKGNIYLEDLKTSDMECGEWGKLWAYNV